jgi:hypothetical protein
MLLVSAIPVARDKGGSVRRARKEIFRVVEPQPREEASKFAEIAVANRFGRSIVQDGGPSEEEVPEGSELLHRERAEIVPCLPVNRAGVPSRQALAGGQLAVVHEPGEL